MDDTKKTKYYIKDKQIFNSLTKKYQIPQEIKDLTIPTETKNILTNNKIIITDLKKLQNKSEKEIELTKPIENFDEIKTKIETLKKESPEKIQKPKDDNYDFIEKTSQIEIIEQIINTLTNQDLKHLEEKLENYITKTKSIEKEKKAQIEEEIDIQNEKIRRINLEKQKYIKTNIELEEKVLNELENNLKILNNKEEKLQKKLETLKIKNNKTKNSEKNKEKIESIEEKIRNLEYEIRIYEPQLGNLKDQIKLGEKKCVNWYLFVLTIGMIYWTKYSDCKYKLVKINQKINKKKEKILRFQKKIYDIDYEVKKQISKNKKENLESNQKEGLISEEIENNKEKIDKTTDKITESEKTLDEKNKTTKEFDSEIKKIESKLLDYETLNQEFEKYSHINIKTEFNNLKESKEEKKEILKKLKEEIKNQKISIKEDSIIEL